MGVGFMLYPLFFYIPLFLPIFLKIYTLKKMTLYTPNEEQWEHELLLEHIGAVRYFDLCFKMSGLSLRFVNAPKSAIRYMHKVKGWSYSQIASELRISQYLVKRICESDAPPLEILLIKQNQYPYP